MLVPWLYVCAYLLDWILGDPPSWPHPVRWMGMSISRIEKGLRRVFTHRRGLYIAGGLLWLVIVLGSGLAAWALIAMAEYVHWGVALLVQLWLAFTVLAGRCLQECAFEVLKPLAAKQLPQARVALSYIVGRETQNLNEAEVTQATVETVAENTVDGVVAPLFYLFIGGVPLAIAYKAINTLDSMVGYKNERYRELGYVSARMDDLANYLPARLSWLLLVCAAWLLKYDARSALFIGWRDRYQHKSPNSAWSEATVAGALGIRLGGSSYYFGQRVDKPWIGEYSRAIEPDDIRRACQLMRLSSLLALVLFGCVLM